MPRLKILVAPWLITTCFSNNFAIVCHCFWWQFLTLTSFCDVMIDLSFILPIAKKREDVFTLLQVLTFVDLSFSKMQKTAAAENPFLPICRARDQTPKRRRTILPSVKATSKIDVKRLYLLFHLIHNIVKKSIITTTTILFNRVFQKKKSENYQASALWLVWTHPKKTLYWCLVGSAFYILKRKTPHCTPWEGDKQVWEEDIYND